jgi:hypothetical protein
MTERRPSIFERHPRLTLIVVVPTLLVLLDLGVTRIYALFRPEFYRQHSVFRVKSDIYHHGFQPNVSVDLEYWGPLKASYRINSLGLRDRAVRDVPLTSETGRLLLIGDSFTEGIGVEYEKTFAGLLADALAPRGIEVLNAGAASYTPFIYYRRLKHLIEEVGLRVDEVVVLIDIGDIQDEVTYKDDAAGNVVFRQQRWKEENEANWYFDKPRLLACLPLHNFLRKNMLVASTLYEGLLRAATRGPQRAAAWTLDDAVFEEYGREGLPKAQENMDRLAELLKRHGVRLTVAVYPWKEQIRAHDAESKQVVAWREWAARSGAGFVSCFPAFLEGDADEMIRREFIPGDIHWNEVGHQRIARVLLAYLDGREMPGHAVGAKR